MFYKFFALRVCSFVLFAGLLCISFGTALAQEDSQPVVDEVKEPGPPVILPTDVFPVCIYQPMPPYPDSARLSGVSGKVTLWMYIRADGSVGGVQMYSSSGAESLDQSAIEAAWTTEWTPASNDGIPVGVWTSLSYRFELAN